MSLTKIRKVISFAPLQTFVQNPIDKMKRPHPLLIYWLKVRFLFHITPTYIQLSVSSRFLISDFIHYSNFIVVESKEISSCNIEGKRDKKLHSKTLEMVVNQYVS